MKIYIKNYANFWKYIEINVTDRKNWYSCLVVWLLLRGKDGCFDGNTTTNFEYWWSVVNENW